MDTLLKRGLTGATSPSPRTRTRQVLWVVGVVSLVVSGVVLIPRVDAGALSTTWEAIVGSPLPGAAALACFGLAFVVRALMWNCVLPTLNFSQALAAIHVALLGNHVLPLRLGEILRVTSAVRRGGLSVSSAAASTIMLRGADLVAVVVLATLLGQQLFAGALGRWRWVLLGAAMLVMAAGVVWLTRVARRQRLRMAGGVVAGGAVLAWVLEAGIILQSARWAGIGLSLSDAILVTALTVVAQAVAVAPGGIGTYEAAATGALVALGHGPGEAIAAAITAHALKTAYSLLVGSVALFRPAPGLLGRFRLPRERVLDAASEQRGSGVVVCFLPAYNEERAVADVVRRVPAVAAGLPVRVLVIDDGSSDKTAARAEAAGARVVSFEQNCGLGAAVRRGLREALDPDVAAVVFCDADGEYAPEELERLVEPILAGEADYVVGSRFTGEIASMRPHRRVGNRVLTALLAWIARTPITDGQTGYRAFSREAARRAEVIHDFNYAQVLTLDLLDKGFRYAEVPISYRFRTEGESFVRLGSYLRHVVPAVHRELNAAASYPPT